ncbi:hypothetical protein GOP47_0030572 [Adiantum capillus-veneris]|nr:hypothetical protein GOP47_0030572 [Adiantum capillus-veneris]
MEVLEPIIEDYVSNITSESSSFYKMASDLCEKGPAIACSSRVPQKAMDYEMTSVYRFANQFRVRIYADPYNYFVCQTDDHSRMEFIKELAVKYLNDRYVDRTGVSYKVVKDLDLVDNLG